jgi:hypothetical protein
MCLLQQFKEGLHALRLPLQPFLPFGFFASSSEKVAPAAGSSFHHILSQIALKAQSPQPP